MDSSAIPTISQEYPRELPSTEPEISIEMKQDFITTSTDPYSDRISQVDGVVTCTIPEGRPDDSVYCLVYLTATIEDWPCSTSSALTFSNTVTTQNFQVVFRADTGLKAGDQYQLIISGQWRYSPGISGGSTPTETVTVQIAPFSNLGFDQKVQNLTLDIGERGHFQFEIVNNGNADTMVRVKTAISNGSLDVVLDNTSFELRPNGHRTIKGSVLQVDGEPTIWYVRFYAQGSTQGTRNNATTELKVFTKEPPLLEKGTIRTIMIGGGLSLLVIAVVGTVMLPRAIRKRREERQQGLR
jgi:hypothetical protein